MTTGLGLLAKAPVVGFVSMRSAAGIASFKATWSEQPLNPCRQESRQSWRPTGKISGLTLA
jgi:hypothetical protein